MVALQDPFKFYADQAPNYPITLTQFPPQARALTLLFANVLLLLAPVAIICCWTKHRDITFWYLIVVAFADVGHIYAVYRAVGHEYFFNIAEWNDMIAGNVGASAFLNVNRWLTVLGVFGNLKVGAEQGKRND